MKSSTPSTLSHSQKPISTADAFYRVFCALPKKARLDVARYILQDDEIRHSLELTDIPNDDTLNAFVEQKANTPVFTTIQELQEDLLS